MVEEILIKDIRIDDFDYPLPDSRIPRHPLQERDSCRLLVALPNGGRIHKRFSDLAGLLPLGSMLVCNDTKVINARMAFRKRTGSRIEIFLLEPSSPSDYILAFQTCGSCEWNCLVGNLKKWKEGCLEMELSICGIDRPVLLKAEKAGAGEGKSQTIRFSWDNPEVTFATVLESAGYIPIPPYLKRESETSDSYDYQTVYADVKGSVAAPTAGLHFTDALFGDLRAHNVEVGKLTLHVGAGTFQPVKSDTIGGHPMHTEKFSVGKDLILRLAEQKRKGNPVVAVGTTSVRTLESLPLIGEALASGDESLHVGQWDAYASRRRMETSDSLQYIADWLGCVGRDTLTASTSIMIAPGFEWRMADVLVTNFHQPQSTLLLLVSSFLGGNCEVPYWKKIYNEALAGGYRFLSYGDACLFFRNAGEKGGLDC